MHDLTILPGNLPFIFLLSWFIQLHLFFKILLKVTRAMKMVATFTWDDLYFALMYVCLNGDSDFYHRCDVMKCVLLRLKIL